MTSPALERLAAHYRARHEPARAWKAAGGRVVGYLGADTPDELLLAAGFLPVRVSGDPHGPRDLGERYLRHGGHPATASVLQRLLDGTYGFLDFLVISRTDESAVAVFQALRELQRVEPVATLPPLVFLDLLHLPHRTTTLYNRGRVEDLRAALADWAGRPVEDEQVQEAIALRNEVRRAQARIVALRRARPARLSGVQALQVIGAGMFLPPSEYQALLRDLLAEADSLPPHDGVRVFLTGSAHETTEVYGLLESQGCVVVGEDHDWGDRFAADIVEEGTEWLGAVVQAKQFGAPASARYGIRERAAYTAAQAEAAGAEVVLAYVVEGDEAPPWDFPAQRDALARQGVPAVLLPRQPYAVDPGARLGDVVAAALADRVEAGAP